MPPAQKPTQSVDRVPALPLIAFALPTAHTAFMVWGPAVSIVPTFYGTEFGLGLAVVSSALLLSRLVDAVVDPLIGYLSDLTKSPIGRRKPWLIAGGIALMTSGWFLYVPPAHPSYWYFLFSIVALYVSWSMIDIPSSAWGAEITKNYEQRSRVFTFQRTALQAGVFAFYLLPYLPIFSTTAVTPQTIRFVAYIGLVFIPLSAVATLIWGPKSVRSSEADRYSLFDFWPLIRDNRPLWWFLGAYICFGLSAGMWGAGTFLYISGYLGLAKEFVAVMAVLQISALLSMPAALWLINRFGKHRTWTCGLLMGLTFFSLMLLLPHGRAALIPLLLLNIPIGFGNAILAVAPLSVLGDIVDYDTLKTGKRRAGTFSALYIFATKINTALGGSIALAIIGLCGYNPKLGATNTAGAVLGLKMAWIVLPTLIIACAGFFAWTFPIDRRRQGIIMRRIEQRDRRAAAGA